MNYFPCHILLSIPCTVGFFPKKFISLVKLDFTNKISQMTFYQDQNQDAFWNVAISCKSESLLLLLEFFILCHQAADQNCLSAAVCFVIG